MAGPLNAQDKIQNINFLFANNGYGFGYEYEKFQKSNVSIGLDLRFYDIRNDEYPIYDPFYNQFTVAGEKDILLFPLFFYQCFLGYPKFFYNMSCQERLHQLRRSQYQELFHKEYS